MKNIPPKHAWACPICDKPAPLHRIRLDAFAQGILDSTEKNVTEVLVADNGKWEVCATDEPDSDDSEDNAVLESQFRRAQPVDLQQAALNLGKAPTAQAPRPAPPKKNKAPPEPVKPDKKEARSRSPKRKGINGKENGGEEPEEKQVDKMKVWEKLQGIEKPKKEKKEKPKEPEEPKEPEKPKEETRFGWITDGSKCSRCDKVVSDQGGIFCGRKLADGTIRGCHYAICWKCMNKASKAEIGDVKCSKTEFASLGDDAWWMHAKCMSKEDRRAYDGEEEDEDEDAPKKKGDDSDDDGGKFAWE